jgi:predicted ArsR family transcriptional regulator
MERLSTRIMLTCICIIRVSVYNTEVKTTRQRISEFLQRRQRASATELSHALHLTAADVRHHLQILEVEGVVEVAGQRPALRRGRPTLLYQLTRQASLNNLARLSNALLMETYQSIPEPERRNFNKRLAQRLVGDNFQPARNPSQRFVKAVQLLNQMNYQARWEARHDAPLVIFTHCPYADILPGQPELCQLDAELLALLLANPVKQTICSQVNLQGISQCIFAIK